MWIIGDGGSPERAQDNTRASFELAIAEWADGILVHLHETPDHALVLSRSETIRTAQGDRSLSALDSKTLEEIQPIRPQNGTPYPLFAFPKLMEWLGTDPIRAFFTPSGTLLENQESLSGLGKILMESRTRIPAFLVLPSATPSPAGIPADRIWRSIDQESDLPPEKNRPGLQAIVPLGLALSGQCTGFSKILVTTTGPVPEFSVIRRLPGFWGVITPTPYFTRKAATLASMGGTH
ncbi:MAG: hypothetical protein ACYCYP_05295 [Leptospirales bacterium]